MLLTLLTLGCLPAFETRTFAEDPAHDFDGDGVTESAGDCDDQDTMVAPGLEERCDARDNDCDGRADEDPVDASTWYRDADVDGFGNAQLVITGCAPGDGYVAEAGDCDDASAAVYPGATETCSPIDDNCDGDLTPDPGATLPSWFLDRDRDGFGDDGTAVQQCDGPAGYVLSGGDCDDGEYDVRPYGRETCDGVDNDCDALVDDADPDAAVDFTWYVDSDGDGFGDSAASAQACAAPAGHVGLAGDCDDSAAGRFPGATETCDGVDQDCDGRVDDGVQVTFYADLDADGFGDGGGATVDACDAPAGFVLDAEDCDDTDARAYPDAEERCNEADDDCDGFVDEVTSTEHPIDALTVYADADADGHGDATRASWACELPEGNAFVDDDCDDTRDTVSPSATETCATLFDDDCDGDANEVDAPACVEFLADADADGYGATGDERCQCTAGAGYTARVDGDCDDADGLVNPGARERCSNPADDDCDGDVNDIGADGCDYRYADVDGDGFGPDALDRLCLCADEGNYTATTVGDCDDALSRVSPAGTEACDEVDEDCDGAVDDDAVDALTWYADADGDGHGDGVTLLRSCEAPGGFVASTDDCDDARPNVYPGATESCFNSYDDDCDGDDNDAGATGCTNWYLDADGDGYGSTTALCLCEADATTDFDVRTRTDCDDGSSARSPGLPELCSTTTVDDDCDGTVNEADASGCTNYYTDVDGDGYGTGSGACLCAATGTRTATVIGDCDDADRTVNPGAANCGYAGAIDWSGDAIAVVPDPDSAYLIEPPDYAINTHLATATGDFNGDGLGDLAFGAPLNSTEYSRVGGVWIYYGPFPATMDLDSESSADLVLAADGTYRLSLGGSLAFGDFDGDGSDELLTSGVYDTSTTSRTVTALLYDYASTGTGVVDYATAATPLGATFVGGTNAWDVNGDGADDLMVGGTLYWGGSGAPNPFTASGSNVGTGLNQSEPIDLNGDGYSDVVTNLGVYLGAPDARWTPARPDVVLANGYGLRDWNADGYSDVVVGRSYDGPTYTNPYTGATVTQPDWGRADVYAGSLTSAATLVFSVIGDEDYEEVGQHVWSGGDIDGDGRTDVWVEKLFDAVAFYLRPYCDSANDLTLWYGGQTGSLDATSLTVAAYVPAWGPTGGACDYLGNEFDQNWMVLPLGDTDGGGTEDTFIRRDFTQPSSGAVYLMSRRMSVLPGQAR